MGTREARFGVRAGASFTCKGTVPNGCVAVDSCVFQQNVGTIEWGLGITRDFVENPSGGPF